MISRINVVVVICTSTIVIYNGLSILIQLLSPKSSEYNENKVENYQNEFIKFCIGLALLIWCGIELMEPCVQDKLTNNRIYILLEYWFFFGCAFIALLVCIHGFDFIECIIG